ncbi:HNH endonuclease [Streptomyces sp. NBRC 109706]|uniref:HNH endonuclease n=1 Tax=Streptomyces sp. NBRC 109706 TaxID=1550035 RepID=UPI00078204B2|nr:HNH endonuclease signature motif containing protein [Streptomyces sp. NBRC 109706]
MAASKRRGHLNGATTRARKQVLAARDGARCAYCLVPFTSLTEATLEHIAPFSLFPTWRAVHLVLACRPCNDRKANHLSLLLALTLLATERTPHGAAMNTTTDAVNTTVAAVNIPADTVNTTTDAVNTRLGLMDRPGCVVNDSPPLMNTGAVAVNTPANVVNTSGGPLSGGMLQLLARLAHARQTANRAAWRARWEVAA